MAPQEGRIKYTIMDEISGEEDSFSFNIEGSLDYGLSRMFTGLEWHNRTGNMPYPIRYEVEVSNLAYGLHDDPSDLHSVAYFPYDQLVPDSEGIAKEYPVSFHGLGNRKGFVTYGIGPGKHGHGHL